MKEFLLPYGKEKLTVKVEDEHFAGVLLSELHSYKAPKSGAELVQDALEHPIGTPRLCDMAVGKQKIVVISSDHTRPVPSHIMMPLILAEIRKGNPDADITILISTGLHRTTTKEELEAKFGPEIMANEKKMCIRDRLLFPRGKGKRFLLLQPLRSCGYGAGLLQFPDYTWFSCAGLGQRRGDLSDFRGPVLQWRSGQ